MDTNTIVKDITKMSKRTNNMCKKCVEANVGSYNQETHGATIQNAQKIGEVACYNQDVQHNTHKLDQEHL